MHSSTSSSSQDRARAARIGPAGLALAITLLALAGMAGVTLARAVPPRHAANDDPASAPASCDIVLVGDSHARQGVIPSAIAAALGGVRVANAARPGMPLSPEFLRAAGEQLDPTSAQRCLAIGITLATQKSTLRHLRHEFARTQPWLGGLDAAAARAWPTLLSPYTLPVQPPRVRVSTLHPDGWRERDYVVRRDPRAAIEEERWNLLAHPFDRMMLEANRVALADLAARGVRVVLFTMPSDVAAIEPLVERWAGMTALDYARRICPPDGTVLDLTFAQGDTYDGHHLHPDAARRVSAELARGLARGLARERIEPPAPAEPSTPAAPPGPPPAAGAPPR